MESYEDLQFVKQFGHFIFIQVDMNHRWCRDNAEKIKDKAIYLKQLLSRELKSEKMKRKNVKKIIRKTDKWRNFHRIYGLKNDKTIRCFSKLLIYIERYEDLVQEDEDDNDDDDDEDDDDKHGDTGYEGYMDMVREIAACSKKLKTSMVVYLDSPLQGGVRKKMRPHSLEEFVDYPSEDDKENTESKSNQTDKTNVEKQNGSSDSVQKDIAPKKEEKGIGDKSKHIPDKNNESTTEKGDVSDKSMPDLETGRPNENMNINAINAGPVNTKDMVDTKTVPHDENGKHNKSEKDLKDALSVKEKDNDSKEKTIKGLYATLLMRLHILSGTNLKSDKSAAESNAYTGMVFVVHTNTSHETLLAPASVLSEAYLLFDGTTVMTGRCEARVTWDPGGSYVEEKYEKA